MLLSLLSEVCYLDKKKKRKYFKTSLNSSILSIQTSLTIGSALKSHKNNSGFTLELNTYCKKLNETAVFSFH